MATSRWARWLGMPVAWLAAVLYFAIALGALYVAVKPSGPARAALLTVVLTAAGAIVWFLGLQLLVIRRACLYCNFVHALGFTTLLLVLADGAIFTRGVVGAAGGGLAVLIAGQLLQRHKTYAVIPGPAASLRPGAGLGRGGPGAASRPSEIDGRSDPSPESSAPATAGKTVSREVQLLGGAVRLSAADWPLMGSGDAAHLIALFFDYTCPVCRAVHGMLGDAVERDRSALAVLVLPIPQHPACNPRVKQVLPGHGYACQYARLAIAVHQARPESYEAFDRFVFADAELPPIGMAMRKASELAGVTLDPHRPDERTEALLRRAFDLYQTMTVKKIPQLLLPNAAVPGRVDSVAELNAILSKELHAVA